ncbi:hypothetical protein FVA81_15625 [Rhizobium sp. WL3]|nr:hypothetical protein FVA81_15625 [Rhizobium sp. WL3]
MDHPSTPELYRSTTAYTYGHFSGESLVDLIGNSNIEPPDTFLDTSSMVGHNAISRSACFNTGAL